MHFFYRAALLAAFSLIIGTAFFFPARVRAQQPQQQQRERNDRDRCHQGAGHIARDDLEQSLGCDWRL